MITSQLIEIANSGNKVAIKRQVDLLEKEKTRIDLHPEDEDILTYLKSKLDDDYTFNIFEAFGNIFNPNINL